MATFTDSSGAAYTSFREEPACTLTTGSTYECTYGIDDADDYIIDVQLMGTTRGLGGSLPGLPTDIGITQAPTTAENCKVEGDGWACPRRP